MSSIMWLDFHAQGTIIVVQVPQRRWKSWVHFFKLEEVAELSSKCWNIAVYCWCVSSKQVGVWFWITSVSYKTISNQKEWTSLWYRSIFKSLSGALSVSRMWLLQPVFHLPTQITASPQSWQDNIQPCLWKHHNATGAWASWKDHYSTGTSASWSLHLTLDELPPRGVPWER